MSIFLRPRWKPVLEAFWSRAGLGPLPPGGRGDRWNLTVDGREVRFTVSPDESRLVVDAVVQRISAIDDVRDALMRPLRTSYGLILTSSATLRMRDDERGGSVLVVEDVFRTEQDADPAELDALVAGLADRAALHAAELERAGVRTQVGLRAPRTGTAKPSEAASEMIFRP